MKNSFHIASVFALLFLLTACGAESVQIDESPVVAIDSEANTAVPDLSVPAATPKTELPTKEANDYTVAGTQLAGTVTPTETANGEVLIGGDAVAPAVTPGEVSFTVLGENFSYDLDEITVKEGDKVTITFRSSSGFHDWVVDEFDAATAKVSTGDEASVTFVADKKGTFEFYCSVGSHRANGMVGKLIVE